MKTIYILVVASACLTACKKSSNTPPAPSSFTMSFTVDGVNNGTNNFNNVGVIPVIRFKFSSPVQTSGITNNFAMSENGATIPIAAALQNNDSVVFISPIDALKGFKKYTLVVSPGLQSSSKGNLANPATLQITTGIDSSYKLLKISDSALLTLVEQQTFKYFWDFGHPVSGLARERTSSGDIVTTGGSGFGVMSMLVAVQRNFITQADALTRIDTIVSFLTTKATRYHGAFSHWINGATGATIPFGQQDDGGDIVETAYMMQGLLCARQYFNSTTDANEINLRAAINNLYDGVEWNWYRQNNQNVLTWNWSPDFNWVINVPVRGWDEALITYVMAASSNVVANRIPKMVYDNGWANNGGEKNGRPFFGITLPLGPDYGGPLFFAHYSFLGINPHNLTDAYANYWQQDTAHAMINYSYCVNNPKHFYGYSNLVWGLTASDIPSGYDASSPTNDLGVIAPTAAVSSLPYTPTQSMNAIRFYYYILGDKLWGQYGFIDAFNLSALWFDSDQLAIDQGPEIIMIENYRSGLLWNLFMSCPEVKTGMTALGFASPNL
jgi:hypothetical protein